MKNLLLAALLVSGCNKYVPTEPEPEQKKFCEIGVGHMEQDRYIRDSVITVPCESLPPRMDDKGE
jgi:hypothetical protein